MSFISYAQNFEDLMLWRALLEYGSGFYIDVGACDPIADSVTKVFYDAGWRGINIEPMKVAFDKLEVLRPRDINLNVGLDSHSGVKTFYSIDNGNGLSTSVKEYADSYVQDGKNVKAQETIIKTLNEIVDKYVNEEVHFLKIDVEGSEKFVLEGADFSKFRPWIVLVESTVPNTTILSHSDWEGILIDSNYTFVYFDGLNRFYVSNEKLDSLKIHFSTPPNWFDHFQRSSDFHIAQELEKYKGIILEMQNSLSLITDDKVKKDSQELSISDITTESIAHQYDLVKKIINDLHFKVDTIENKNINLNKEIDCYKQELYENARYIGALCKERQNANVNAYNLNQHLHTQNYHISQLELWKTNLQNEIDGLKKSRSWKLTRPLRQILLISRKLRGLK